MVNIWDENELEMTPFSKQGFVSYEIPSQFLLNLKSRGLGRKSTSGISCWRVHSQALSWWPMVGVIDKQDVNRLVDGEEVYMIVGVKGIETKHVLCIRFLTSILEQEN